MQIVAGIHLIALRGEIVAAGAEHQQHIRIRLPDAARHLYAVHAVHENVQQHHVEGSGVPRGQKRLPAGKDRDLRAALSRLCQLRFYQRRQRRAFLAVILHQRQTHLSSSFRKSKNSIPNFQKKAMAPEGIYQKL